MLEKINRLLPAHNILAARELLGDLRAIPELAPYLMEDIWLKADQSSAIAALTGEHGVCLGVGIGEKSLAGGTLANQGNAIDWTLCVYAFQPVRGTDHADLEKLERIITTAYHYAMRFNYTVPGGDGAKSIAAKAQSITLVDLGREAGFEPGGMRAEALILTLRGVI